MDADSPDVNSEPSLSFFVPGVPRPGGSKVSFMHRVTGKMVVKESGKYTKDWRSAVSVVAWDAMRKSGLEVFKGPLLLVVTFSFLRPKSHFRTNGQLKPNAPLRPTGPPDVTKLMRSTEDAMKGITWVDDSNVVRQFGEKIYADAAGAQILIRKINT